MANRVRPRCPTCGSAMTPLFRRGGRGAYVKVADVFTCPEDDVVARGRRKIRFL